MNWNNLPTDSLQVAYLAVSALMCLSLVVSTLEHLGNRKFFLDSGVFSWRVNKLRSSFAPYPKLLSISDRLLGYRGTLILLTLRLLSVLSMLLGLFLQMKVGLVPATLLLTTTLLFNLRYRFAEDGSDQVNTLLVVVVCLLAFGQETRLTLWLGLWFLSLQMCLAYFVSGYFKLVSPQWRNGQAIFDVLNTETFGRPNMAELIQDKTNLQKTVTWCTLVFELMFPLVLFTPYPVVYIFFLGGVLLHGGIALVMGLNSFFWAFIATYPALWICSLQLQAVLGY